MTSDVAQSQAKESKLLEWIGSTEDAKEGVVSFVEKRAPKWSMSADRDFPKDLIEDLK